MEYIFKMDSDTSTRGTAPSPPPGSNGERITLPHMIDHIRTGQLIRGPLQPYKWLEYAAKPKTEQELQIQRVMDGCTFKSIMSFVVGGNCVSLFSILFTRYQ